MAESGDAQLRANVITSHAEEAHASPAKKKRMGAQPDQDPDYTPHTLSFASPQRQSRGSEAGPAVTPPRRTRGRPPGAKNKRRTVEADDDEAEEDQEEEEEAYDEEH